MEQEYCDYEDSILVARTVDGDLSAFDKLVERHRSRLYVAALSVTRNEEDASDAVSDAILRAFRSVGSFRSEAKFSTWLHRIVVNCAKNLIMKAKRQSTVSLDQIGDTLDETAIKLIAPEADTEWEDLMRKASVYAARELERMPREQRDLIVSFHRNSVPYESLAMKLDIPIGTLKSRMFRARRRLRSRLPSLPELADRYN